MPRIRQRMPLGWIVKILLLGTMVFQVSLQAAEALIIENPYEAVNWQTAQQLKANLHTHTTESDGRLSPAEVIDRYHAKSYKILALTDHDSMKKPVTTWPWTQYDRDPVQLGMLAIQGNELSRGHHRGSFFNDLGEFSKEIPESFHEIKNRGGLAMLYHPGRYKNGADWYVALFQEFDILIGLEVYNQGDRYPKDRELWDNILTKTMPDRPVWGWSNDDMHLKEHLFRNYNFLLIEGEQTEATVRQALLRGQGYFSYEPRGSGDARAPRIQAIDVRDGTITIESPDAEQIEWIANGSKVAEGKRVDIRNLVAPEDAPFSYIRAQLINQHGRTYTQPFGLRRN